MSPIAECFGQGRLKEAVRTADAVKLVRLWGLNRVSRLGARCFRVGECGDGNETTVWLGQGIRHRKSK